VAPAHRLRPATDDDRTAAAALMRAVELARGGMVTADWDEISGFIWRDPGFAPADDARMVVSGDGEVLGFTAVFPTDEAGAEPMGAIAQLVPAREHDAELTGSLIEWDLARARERGAPGIRTWVTRGDDARVALLAARGFRQVRTQWTMHRELPDPEAPGGEPAGIAIRTLAEHPDLEGVHAADQDAFAEHYGFAPESFETWRALRVDADTHDDTQWFVAVDGGEVVGYLHQVSGGDIAQVAELGVRKPWRRRGVATALLRRSFADLAGRGEPEVTLWVDSENATGAVGVYERVGMRAIVVTDIYQADLGG
jgi:mycothiol synthase